MDMSLEDIRMREPLGNKRGDGVGLVLTDNMIAGHQIAHLLASAHGSKMRVLRRDKQATLLISEGRVDVVVADIDRAALGGLAVLTYTKRHWPAVTTYALTRNEDAYVKQLAQDMGGCRDFFYLSKERPSLDMHRGLAARISAQMVREQRASLGGPTPPQYGASAEDQTPALFTLLKRNRLSEEAHD